ncbi:MAG: hypothetical protein GX571_04755 [Lentisphaerae bacterium]|jgi:hypothetical protein|nr:hypothetical protein [Lentisphaerota bacterium]
MNGKPDPNSATRNADAYTVVRWLAFVLANGRVYGLAHKITQQSILDAAQALALFHRRHGDFELAVVDDDFQVEGVSVGPPIASTIALARCLAGLNAPCLCFQEGISAEDLNAFARMLFLKEEQVRQANGLAGLLSASGLTRIRAVGFSYQRVTEHETVVEEDETPATGLSAASVAAIRRFLDSGAAAASPVDAESLRQVDLGDDKTVGELARLVAPPETPVPLSPEALAQQTIERLQRMSDDLLEAPSNQTVKGRRNLRKLITSVEADVTERLQHLGADIQAVEMLASRVKELIEGLAVDGLVAQYMKLRGELAAKEGKLKRHLRRAGQRGGSEKEIKSRLVSMGLPASILEDLAASAAGGTPDGGADGAGTGTRSGGAADGAGTGTGSTASGGQVPAAPEAPAPETPLTDLLRQLQSTAPGDGALPRLVDNILSEMNKTLQQTALRAEAQMETLKRIVMIPAGRPDNADLSRRQLLILMAELGQELRQPLTVVTGAIDMLLGRFFGPISDEQKPILGMASESNRRLDELISRMIRIAGMPTSLTPDADILARIK